MQWSLSINGSHHLGRALPGGRYSRWLDQGASGLEGPFEVTLLSSEIVTC